MSEARSLGITRCLVAFVGYPDCLHIVDRYADKYWSDGEDDWHSDDEFMGWIPMPEYRPDAKRIDKAALYEKIRRLNPREFADLYERNIRGEGNFDDLVNLLP